MSPLLYPTLNSRPPNVTGILGWRNNSPRTKGGLLTGDLGAILSLIDLNGRYYRPALYECESHKPETTQVAGALPGGWSPSSEADLLVCLRDHWFPVS